MLWHGYLTVLLFSLAFSFIYRARVFIPMQNCPSINMVQGVFTFVIGDLDDHHCLKFVIGWDMSGGPTLVYTRSPKIKVSRGEHVKK